jgi:hypothetical protein
VAQCAQVCSWFVCLKQCKFWHHTVPSSQGPRSPGNVQGSPLKSIPHWVGSNCPEKQTRLRKYWLASDSQGCINFEIFNLTLCSDRSIDDSPWKLASPSSMEWNSSQSKSSISCQGGVERWQLLTLRGYARLNRATIIQSLGRIISDDTFLVLNHIFGDSESLVNKCKML